MLEPYNLPLLPIKFATDTELSFYKLVVEAATQLEKLKQKLYFSPVSESFIQLIGLKESVQSMKIEGSQVTFSDMLEHQLSEEKDWESIEVINYQKVLKIGAERIEQGYPLTERLIRELHAVLMEGARGSTGLIGEYRKVQNFIGPTRDIKDAQYIPPEPQKVAEYMGNLELYMNDHPYSGEQLDDLHPLIKTAIIHAQFESIHPFSDGNGRLGRILIVLYLLRKKLIDRPVFFLSEELEREQFKYYQLLNGVRAIKGKEADWQSWVIFFLESTIKMAKRQFSKLDQAEKLYVEINQQLKQPSLKKIWFALFTHPITTVKDMQQLTGLSDSTVRKGLNLFEEKHYIFGNDYRRNRRYYFYDLIRIMSN